MKELSFRLFAGLRNYYRTLKGVSDSNRITDRKRDGKDEGSDAQTKSQIKTTSDHLKCLLTCQRRQLGKTFHGRSSRQYCYGIGRQLFRGNKIRCWCCCCFYCSLENINNQKNNFKKQHVEMEKRRKKRRRKGGEFVEKRGLNSLSNFVRLKVIEDVKEGDFESLEQCQMKTKALGNNNVVLLFALLLFLGCLPIKFAHSLQATNHIQPSKFVTSSTFQNNHLNLDDPNKLKFESSFLNSKQRASMASPKTNNDNRSNVNNHTIRERSNTDNTTLNNNDSSLRKSNNFISRIENEGVFANIDTLLESAKRRLSWTEGSKAEDERVGEGAEAEAEGKSNNETLNREKSAELNSKRSTIKEVEDEAKKNEQDDEESLYKGDIKWAQNDKRDLHGFTRPYRTATGTEKEKAKAKAKAKEHQRKQASERSSNEQLTESIRKAATVVAGAGERLSKDYAGGRRQVKGGNWLLGEVSKDSEVRETKNSKMKMETTTTTKKKKKKRRRRSTKRNGDMRKIKLEGLEMMGELEQGNENEKGRDRAKSEHEQEERREGEQETVLASETVFEKEKGADSVASSGRIGTGERSTGVDVLGGTGKLKGITRSESAQAELEARAELEAQVKAEAEVEAEKERERETEFEGAARRKETEGLEVEAETGSQRVSMLPVSSADSDRLDQLHGSTVNEDVAIADVEGDLSIRLESGPINDKSNEDNYKSNNDDDDDDDDADSDSDSDNQSQSASLGFSSGYAAHSDSNSNPDGANEDDYNDYGAYVIYDISARNSSSNSISISNSNSYFKARSLPPISTLSQSSMATSQQSLNLFSSTAEPSQSTSTSIPPSNSTPSSSSSSSSSSPFQVVFFAATPSPKSARSASSQIATYLLKQKVDGRENERLTALPYSDAPLKKLNFSKDLPASPRANASTGTDGELERRSINSKQVGGDSGKRRQKQKRKPVKGSDESAAPQRHEAELRSSMSTYDGKTETTLLQLKANDRLFKLGAACRGREEQEVERRQEEDEEEEEVEEEEEGARVFSESTPELVHNMPSAIQSEFAQQDPLSPAETPPKLNSAAPVGPSFIYQARRGKTVAVDDEAGSNSSLNWRELNKNNSSVDNTAIGAEAEAFHDSNKTDSSATSPKASPRSPTMIQHQRQQQQESRLQSKIGEVSESDLAANGKVEPKRGLSDERSSGNFHQIVTASPSNLGKVSGQKLARRPRDEGFNPALRLPSSSSIGLTSGQQINSRSQQLKLLSSTTTTTTNPFHLSKQDATVSPSSAAANSADDKEGSKENIGEILDEPAQLAEDDVKWLRKMSESGSSSSSSISPSSYSSPSSSSSLPLSSSSGASSELASTISSDDNSLGSQFEDRQEKKTAPKLNKLDQEQDNPGLDDDAKRGEDESNQISNQEVASSTSFIRRSLARLGAFLLGERKEQKGEEKDVRSNMSKVDLSHLSYHHSEKDKSIGRAKFASNSDKQLVNSASTSNLHHDRLKIMMTQNSSFRPLPRAQLQANKDLVVNKDGQIVGLDRQLISEQGGNDHNTYMMSSVGGRNVNLYDKSSGKSRDSTGQRRPVISSSGYKDNENENGNQNDNDYENMSNNKENINEDNDDSLSQRHFVTYNNATLQSELQDKYKLNGQIEHNVYYWRLIWFILPIGATFGNLLVIMAVYMERSLQSVTNYFIVSLAFADLFVGLIVMPFAVYVLVNEVWELSDAICDIYVAVDVTCSTASILNLVAISIDRYRAVAHPISYSARSSSTRAIITIFAVWLISCCVGAPIILGLNTSPERQSTLCILYNSTFIFWSSLTSFYAPCIIMIGLYWRIFSAIRSRTKKAIGSADHHPTNNHLARQHQTLAISVAANTNSNTNNNLAGNVDKIKSDSDESNTTKDKDFNREIKPSSYAAATYAPTTLALPQDDTKLSNTSIENELSNSNNNHLMMKRGRTDEDEDKRERDIASLSAQLEQTTNTGRLFSVTTTSYSDTTFADMPSSVAPSREPTSCQMDLEVSVEHEGGSRNQSNLSQSNATKSAVVSSRKVAATNAGRQSKLDKESDLDILQSAHQSISGQFEYLQSGQASALQVNNSTYNASKSQVVVQATSTELHLSHQTPSSNSQTERLNTNSPCLMFTFSRRLEDFELNSLHRLLQILSQANNLSNVIPNSIPFSTESSQTAQSSNSEENPGKFLNGNHQLNNSTRFTFERLNRCYFTSSSKERCLVKKSSQFGLVTQILKFSPVKSKSANQVNTDLLNNICFLFMMKAYSVRIALLDAISLATTNSNPQKFCLQLKEFDTENDYKDEYHHCSSDDNADPDMNGVKLIREQLNQLTEDTAWLMNLNCRVNPNQAGEIDDKTCCACCGKSTSVAPINAAELLNCSSNLSICFGEPIEFVGDSNNDQKAQLNRLTVMSIGNKSPCKIVQFLSARDQLGDKSLSECFIIWVNNIDDDECDRSIGQEKLFFESTKLNQSKLQKLCKECQVSCSLCSIVYGNKKNMDTDTTTVIAHPKRITARSVSANVTPIKTPQTTKQAARQKPEKEIECLHLSRLLKEEHRSKLPINQTETGNEFSRKSFSDSSGSEQDVSMSRQSSRSSTMSYRHGGLGFGCDSRSESESSGSITGYDCSVSHINDSQRSSRNSWSRRSCCQALANCAICERLLIASYNYDYQQNQRQRQPGDTDRNNNSSASLIGPNGNAQISNEDLEGQIGEGEVYDVTPIKKKISHLNRIYDDYDNRSDNNDNDDGEEEGVGNEIQATNYKNRWFRSSNQSDTPICECSIVGSKSTFRSNRQVAEQSRASSQLQIHQQQCKHFNQHRAECSSRSHSVNISVMTTSITEPTSTQCICLQNDCDNRSSSTRLKQVPKDFESCQLHNDNSQQQQQPYLTCQHAAGVLHNATEKIKRRSIRLGQLIRGKNSSQKQVPISQQQPQNTLAPRFYSHITSDESRFSSSNTATINPKSVGTTTTSSGQQSTSLQDGTLIEENPDADASLENTNKLKNLSIELVPNNSSSKYSSDKSREFAALRGGNCLTINPETIAQASDRDVINQVNTDDKQRGFIASVIHFMHPQPKTKLHANNNKYNGTRSTPTLAISKDNTNVNRQRTGSRRRREKNAAKRERKATKTLAIVLGVFLICWTPFFTCNIIDGICIQLNIDCRPGMMVYLVTSWLGYINSCVNPIIYTIFNMEFRRAFKRILTTSPACFNGQM